MKTKYPVTPLIRQELVKAGIKRFKNVKVDNDSYAHLRSMIDNGGYGHLTDEERHAIAVGCCLTHPQHRNKHRALPRWFWFAVPIIAILVLFFAVKASAQTSQIDVITFRDASGVTIRSFAAPFSIKCSTNVTCAAAGSTLTITASGGGAGGYATIQSHGVAIATETVVNFLGALACVDDAANTRTNCQLTANIAVANQYVTGIDANGNFTRKQIAYSELSGPPTLAATKAAIASNWLNSYDSTTGLFTATRPAYTDLTGLPQLAVTKAAVASNWIRSYDSTTGLFTASRPVCGDLSDSGTNCTNSTAIPAVPITVGNGGLGQSNTGASGKIPIGDGSGHFVEGDPLVQGTQAAGSTTIPSPIVPGGSDYSGTPTVRAQKVDANGNLYVALASAPTLTVSLPQQPFLNTTDFNDVVASSPTRGDFIVANSTPKYARFPVGATNTLLHGGTDPTWSAVAQADVTGGYCDLTTNQTCAGNKAFTGSTSIGLLSSKIYVDGVKYPYNQAGIQQAFTDACAVNIFASFGTDVYIPPMIINLTNTTTQQFLISCALNIHGSGIWATWFVIDASVPSTIPLFRIKPTTTQSQEFMEYDHFRVAGNTSGGDAFLFDSSGTGNPTLFRIHDTQVTGLSANAWAVNNTGAQVNWGWAHIYDNDWVHGIHMNTTTAVDSWLIEHNRFGSTAGSTNPCIDASTAVGASLITVAYNNGGCTGGFFTTTGTTQCKLLYNQIEETAGTGDANNALIDLLGTTYSVNDCEIVGNNLNVHNTATNNIRLGTTKNTHIENNTIAEKPTTGVGILVTANSTGTRIGWNDFIDSTAGGALTGGQIPYSMAAAAAVTATSLGSFDWPQNMTGQADIVADSAAINTTETIIVKTPAIPANRLIPGTHIRMTLTGTCTTTVANTSTFTIRMGTAGTTADTAIATPVTTVAGTTGTNIPFKTVIEFTVRTAGATGTGSILFGLDSNGLTGIVAAQTPQLLFPAMSTFNTTTASNILSVSYKSAATTTTSTFKTATIEIVQN